MISQAKSSSYYYRKTKPVMILLPTFENEGHKRAKLDK